MATLFVHDAVQSAPVVIFTRDGCPYCWRAVLLMRELKQEPKIISLDQLEGAIACHLHRSNYLRRNGC